MIEIPSQTAIHSLQNSETILDKKAVKPMATHRMFLSVWMIDSLIDALGGVGTVFSPNLKYKVDVRNTNPTNI